MTTHEVIVVGGGIGGLTTAALLSARGVNVCLLERGEKVGGCASSFEKFGYKFELGYGIYSGWNESEIHTRVFQELKTEPPKTKLLKPSYIVRLPDGFEIPISNDQKEVEEYLRSAFPECVDTAARFSSHRFNRFITAQQHIFGNQTNKQLHTIEGGAESLANALVESIKRNGGVVRLNSPVLRLAFDTNGKAVGVDLLNGERIGFTKAVVSNLTVWDTFGRLIGLNRTPGDVRQKLKDFHGKGAYQMFLSIDEEILNALPSKRILALSDWEGELEESLFMFSASPNAHDGKCAVTVSTFVNVENWFQFQESQDAIEEMDQEHLEKVWRRLHLMIPELGDGVEIIETFTPRDFYELTRRRLGTVFTKSNKSFSFKTHLPNVFIVSDTITNDWGITAVSELALEVANEIAPQS